MKKVDTLIEDFKRMHDFDYTPMQKFIDFLDEIQEVYRKERWFIEKKKENNRIIIEREKILMNKEERERFHNIVENISIKPPDSMNIVQIKSFVDGYELAKSNIMDAIDRTFKESMEDSQDENEK